jgi:DNA mismatch endonuclease (patch repair protein)
MTDIVPPEVRSRMMAGIRGKDTLPERFIRSGLHRLGFRFRLHPRDVPGCPDIVLPRYRAAIFVHGCFWHGHDCPLFKVPGENREFWIRKIEANRRRDAAVAEMLKKQGWRQLTIWECAMKGAGRLDPQVLLRRCAEWILGRRRTASIRGRQC